MVHFFLTFSEALLGKEHKEQQVNYDVKIGDGMDIAIHGENGKISFEISWKRYPCS